MNDIDLVKTVVTKLSGVMLLDFNMQTSKGLEALRALMNSNLDSLLVVLPVNNTDRGIAQPKVAPSALGNHRATQPQAAAGSSKLTAREREILTLIAEGMTNKMIAQELDISDSTVKVHVKNMLRKLKVNSRLAAAVRALGPRPAKGSEWS